MSAQTISKTVGHQSTMRLNQTRAGSGRGLKEFIFRRRGALHVERPLPLISADPLCSQMPPKARLGQNVEKLLVQESRIAASLAHVKK